MRAVAASLYLLAMASAAMPCASHAAPALANTSAETPDMRVILDMFLSKAKWATWIQQCVEAKALQLKQMDAADGRFLQANPNLQPQLVQRASVKMQAMLVAALPLARAKVANLLKHDMTPQQLQATARLFATPTGVRIIDAAFIEMLTESPDQDESSEMSEAEALKMVREADIPALIAFVESGAGERFEQSMSKIEAMQSDWMGHEIDVESVLVATLAELKTAQATRNTLE